MKIIIFYIFLILIFIPILFKIVFITRNIEGFKGEKKNKEVVYNMTGDNGSYSFIYGKNTIEILPSNKKDKITDVYFHYRSLPDKTIANGNSFDDISSQEFVLKTPTNKYNISFSSSKKPIKIIVNETKSIKVYFAVLSQLILICFVIFSLIVIFNVSLLLAGHVI